MIDAHAGENTHNASGGERTIETRRASFVLAYVQGYQQRGWPVVPLRTRSKAPTLTGWRTARLAEADLPRLFGPEANVAIQVGEPAGGLVDVDLDAPAALALAHTLPETAACFGRPGKPRSHRLYRVQPAPEQTQQYTDVDGTMLVELRSGGDLTMVPPSIHPSGEQVRWESESGLSMIGTPMPLPLQVEPATLPGEVLVQAVERVAAGALLARHWPKQGSRHRCALALAGVLLRHDWKPATAARFVQDVARAAGDEEAEDRARAVTTTARRLAEDRPASGLPHLAEVLDRPVVARLATWLHLPPPDVQQKDPYSDLGADWGRVPLASVPTPAAPPVDALLVPAWQDFVREGSAVLKAPVDYLLVGVLGACSMALGNRHRLHIMARHSASAQIWLLALGNPSANKSAPLGLAMEPLRGLEERMFADQAVAQEQYMRAKHAWDTLRPADRHGQVEPVAPPSTQLLTKDITMEALSRLLLANPRGLGLYCDELAGWLKSFNQYRPGPDRERWLEIYDGRSMCVNRVKDEASRLYVPSPYVPVLGSTQPRKLGSALGPQDDGLKERLLMVYPPETGLTELTDDDIPASTEAAYVALITALLALRMADDVPVQAKLSPKAKQVWWELERAHNQKADAENFPEGLLAAYGKYRGHAARLTCLLHWVRVAAGERTVDPAKADEISVAAAWWLCSYFRSHAHRIHLTLSTATRIDIQLERVVSWIRKHEGCATIRELVSAHVGGIRGAQEARAIVSRIEDRGLGRQYWTQHHGSPSHHIVLAGARGGSRQK